MSMPSGAPDLSTLTGVNRTVYCSDRDRSRYKLDHCACAYVHHLHCLRGPRAFTPLTWLQQPAKSAHSSQARRAQFCTLTCAGSDVENNWRTAAHGLLSARVPLLAATGVRSRREPERCVLGRLRGSRTMLLLRHDWRVLPDGHRELGARWRVAVRWGHARRRWDTHLRCAGHATLGAFAVRATTGTAGSATTSGSTAVSSTAFPTTAPKPERCVLDRLRGSRTLRLLLWHGWRMLSAGHRVVGARRRVAMRRRHARRRRDARLRGRGHATLGALTARTAHPALIAAPLATSHSARRPWRRRVARGVVWKHLGDVLQRRPAGHVAR